MLANSGNVTTLAERAREKKNNNNNNLSNATMCRDILTMAMRHQNSIQMVALQIRKINNSRFLFFSFFFVTYIP